MQPNPHQPEPGSAALDCHPRTAGVLAPPPLLYGAAWLGARALHRRMPLRTRLPHLARAIAGSAGVLTGVALSAAVVREFRHARTAVNPLSPSTALVTSGPFRWTRNPDYIGQTLVYLGAAALADTLWPALILPAVLTALDRGVVRREERYLESKFGSRYRDYASRVPRWL